MDLKGIYLGLELKIGLKDKFLEVRLLSEKVNKYIVLFSSVAQSCPSLCDPMNHSTPGLPVYHQLLEFTQTCVR